ncbi:MAG: radical SAM protein [Bacteroidales bacterium]|nr:radical SAM protein [Bacteroidales bacterium]
MGGFLFQDLIFGPVRSRRLGRSLGINLLPINAKWCNYNCIYCECGWTARFDDSDIFPNADDIINMLENVLTKDSEQGKEIDAITFAGNGEPSLHPEFNRIVKETVRLRNQIFPKAKIAILTNATRLKDESVIEALCMADTSMLKLDSAIQRTYDLINQSFENFKIEEIIQDIANYPCTKHVQTMFFKGQHGGVFIDNTTENELVLYIEALHKIKPNQVIIYSLDRDTPDSNLLKIEPEKMLEIAERLEQEGFDLVYTP